MEHEPDLAEMERLRRLSVDRIVGSGHRLRVVIAGPGTGKTYTFSRALDAVGGPALALTFIRKLAAELGEALGGRAETYTFHKFAKILVYRLGIPGLTPDFSLYPPLTAITNEDLGLLGLRPENGRHVERQMQELEEDETVREVLGLGSYYDSASFVDVVYRVFRFLENNPKRTPEYALVVVDEYQDFTRLETAFIAQLGLASRLLIAGDDDQALYDFRFATAEHVRALAASIEAERHELPFCSRCTLPVVEAVKTVVRRATAIGALQGRLAKPFECYLPEKLEASRLHPELLDVRCTQLGIMARYIENELEKIPPEDVAAAAAGGHSAALIVGPGHFVEPIHEYLKNGKFPGAELRRAEQITVEPIDAYRRLTKDADSNLGWRILIHVRPFRGWERAVLESIETGDPLIDRIPTDYRDWHLAIAQLVRDWSPDDSPPEIRSQLAEALGVADVGLEELLRRPDDREDVDLGWATSGPEPGTPPDGGQPEKTILCTTLPGAKGLSAEHVFVVGLVGGHFPRENAAPTDKEICEFLVALSRTRTACHLVSVDRFGAAASGRRVPRRLPVSVFKSWVAGHTRRIAVTAADLPPIASPRRRGRIVRRRSRSTSAN
jgi:AAA domain